MSTSVSSLGSAQISSQISTVEARLEKPITQLKAQSTTESATISAWGTVQGVLSTLSSSLSGIKDVSTINVRAAASSTPAVATVTAAKTASLGTYDLTGVKLAQAQDIYSGIQTSATTDLIAGSGSQTLSFTLKGSTTPITLTIGSGDSSLNSIASAINKLGGGVKASVVGTSGGARLTLQGSSTGSSQAFTVAGTGALAKFDYTAAAPGSMTSAQKATNAAFNINGVPVSDATNSITDAVPGVTISLTGSSTAGTAGSPGSSLTGTTLTVSSSPGSIAAALGTVASNLNAAIAAIAKQTAYTPASSASGSSKSAAAGALLGSATASNIQNQLLTSVSGAATNGVSSNSIGLTIGTGGAVSFDSSKFATAYAANPTAVTALVTQIYKNISNVTTGALGSAGSTSGSGATAVTIATTSANQGSINSITNGLKSNVISIAQQEAQITSNNNAQLQILVQQYSTAEAASTAASTTEAYLSLFTSSSSKS
jgi:flagellar hook-associated protein 2